MKKLLSGNEAVAYGALASGVKIVSGYPGTPSTEALSLLLNLDIAGTDVEWSCNEKVAFEVAAGGALMGYPTMCTMKMTGVNVCYDSLISIAYTGLDGALVLYVADDPGVAAGMSEQDTRDFALITDIPVLEPSTLQECYDLTKYAFKLAQETGSPVILRSVTSLSQSHGVVEIEDRVLPEEGKPLFEHNMERYTKAGSKICMDQHRDLLARLDKAEEIIRTDRLNVLDIKENTRLGVICVGVVNSYLDEAVEALAKVGIDVEFSALKVLTTLPFPDEELKAMLSACDRILVAEELEAHLENRLRIVGYENGAKAQIIGKMDGTYEKTGYYDASHLIKGLCALAGVEVPVELRGIDNTPEEAAAPRPITVCAGCPHRGTYMSIEAAIRRLKMKKSEVLVTGDIGCTILGTTPPFNIMWTEVAMGASIPLAQGFVYAGTENPVIATIGDSTFFHAGIPGLINAIQHNINMTVIIMDNGWTSMTGMQVNPGTIQEAQKGSWRQLDLVKVVEGLGVDDLHVADPYNLEELTSAIADSMTFDGVSVVIARRECAIQAARRKVKYSTVTIDAEKCSGCKVCVSKTACPALSLAEGRVVLDSLLCNGCGICQQVCKFGAIEKE